MVTAANSSPRAASCDSRVLIGQPPQSLVGKLATAVVVRSLDIVIDVVAFLTKEKSAKSVFLQGHYAAQRKEVIEHDATVTGIIPAELRGLFVNVCPNPLYLPIGGYHIFEGDGALTAVRIHDNGASFAFTQLETEKILQERRNGRSNVVSFMAMNGVSGLALAHLAALRRWLVPSVAPSLANTNIDIHGRNVFAMCENDMPYILGPSHDGATLQCKRHVKVKGYNGPFTAHPSPHPNGCLYSVSYIMQNSDHDAAVVVLDENADLVRVVPINLGRRPMIHDTAITQRYVVILDFPLLLTSKDIINSAKPVIRLHQDQPSRIGLMPVDATDQSEIIWFEAPSTYAFHVVCAYDIDNGIVLYACTKAQFDLVDAFKWTDGNITRYEVDVFKGTIEWRTEPLNVAKAFGVARAFIDFPIVNAPGCGAAPTYVFGSTFAESQDGQISIIGIVKYNLRTQQVEGAIQFESDGHPALGLGEAGFVLRPSLEREDGAYLLNYVRDEKNNSSLNIYDSISMDNTPIARVHAPEGFHIPSGFHSQFFTEQMLNFARIAC